MKAKTKVSFVPGAGGLPMIRVETGWSTAELFLHGAHLARFQKHGESKPITWMSGQSRFEPGVAIRGGIPVILPWFGGREGRPAHGFARICDWTLKDVTTSADGTASLHLQLSAPEEKDFPALTADYVVTVGETLELQLSVTNDSTTRELTLEECLHTYFTVGEIASASVHGLKGTMYLDKVAGGAEKKETGETITVAGEVDRVYQDTLDTVEIWDEKLRRKIRVEKQSSRSTVVWNPWLAKSKAMADFGDDEFHQMICVESGNVGKNQLTLAPGKSSGMRVKISSSAL